MTLSLPYPTLALPRPALAALAGAVLLAASPRAEAQLVTNSRFDAGLTGWTVTPTSTNASGAPGSVELVDIDGPGPLGASAAASFATGKLPPATGPSFQGVVLSQTVQLEAGRDYTLRLDYSSLAVGSSLSGGGRYRALVGGSLLETVTLGNVPADGAVNGVLETQFTAGATGPAALELRIESSFTTSTPPVLFQRVDNVRLETGFSSSPGFQSVFGGGIETFQLDAGPDRAGEAFLIAGSRSGTLPGLDLPGDVHVPLVIDGYTTAVLNGLGAAPFDAFTGLLDGAGRATVSFTLPAGLPPAAVGLTLQHAFVTLGPGGVTFGSNADSILIF